jgi:SAM-dependent methyltransferase
LQCPVCDAGRAVLLRRTPDGFALHDCIACGVGFSDPMRAADAAWYASSPLYTSAKALHQPIGWHHDRFLRVIGAGAGRHLLDVGCGTGAFLAAARERGFAPSGFDFDPEDIDIARLRHGLDDVRVSSWSEYVATSAERCFDVVTLFEVIEHVEDPRALLRGVGRLLRTGGVLGLSTPNRHRGIDPLCDGDLPPNHLTRWSVEALAGVVRGCGFEVERIEVKPVLVEDLVGALRARLRFGVARRMLCRSVAAGDPHLAKRAQLLMQVKDTMFTVVAIPLWLLSRLARRQGVGLLCVARWSG